MGRKRELHEGRRNTTGNGTVRGKRSRSRSRSRSKRGVTNNTLYINDLSADRASKIKKLGIWEINVSIMLITRGISHSNTPVRDEISTLS